MNLKIIYSILIFVTAGLFYYMFVLPFTDTAVTPLVDNLTKLQNGYDRASQQLSLNRLKQAKAALTDAQLNLIQNFVPTELHTGPLVYNLSQLAVQKGLNIKSVQYSIVDDSQVVQGGEKKLLIEYNFSGSYENFYAWLQQIEQSSTLVDVDSLSGTRASNSSNVIDFMIRLFAYGKTIE